MINKRNKFFSALAILILLSPGCTPARKVESETAFEYKEVYLPQSLGKKAAELGLNSIDIDWGIWGHNLGVVLPEKHSESVYAKCFSFLRFPFVTVISYKGDSAI